MLSLKECNDIVEATAKKTNVLREGYAVKWTGHLGKFGSANKRTGVITLSYPILAHSGKEHIVDTFLHELAHIVCPEYGHTPLWKKIAKELGAVPKSQCTLDVKPYNVYCVECGFLFEAYSAKKNRVHASSICNKGKVYFRRKPEFKFIKGD